MTSYPSVSAFDLPPGVSLLSVYLTQEQTKMLSPHPRKLSHRRDGHKPGSVVRSVRRSTNIKTKSPFESSERIPKFDLPRSPVTSMDTTSEDECAGTSFQTEALVHSECTCHGTDASHVNTTTVRSCVQHGSTGVTFPEPKTTRASNTGLPAGLLAECCATVIVNESVQTDTKRPVVVAKDGTLSPNRAELGTVSRSRQYTQCHANNSSHANIEPDNSVGLSEVIGNMLYDISYEMRCDKLNLEDQTSYRDDRIRSGIPDFVSMQNDSGVLDDSSPGVKIVDNLENSTSDFDLTDGGNVVAMDDSSETSGCCVGGVEDVQKVVSEDNFTHDFSTSSVVDADTMLFVALRNSATTANTTPTTIMTMDESGGLVSGNYCAEGKYVATEHSNRKECVNENVNMNVEGEQGHSERRQDGVKLVETCDAARLVVDSESVHKTENESDAEIAFKDGMKNEAIHEATSTMDVETRTESAVKIDSENCGVVRNQDDMKHEATINADVENENTGKTESNVEMESETNVVEVEQDGDVKLVAIMAKDVETESECGCKPRSESDIGVTDKDDMKYKATISRGDETESVCKTEHEDNVSEDKDDTRCDSTIAVYVETESEQACKTESENSVDIGQDDDVRHEIGISVNDIDVRNQGDMKRETIISKGVDSEHVCRTESETDDEIDRQEETRKAVIAMDVETENVHVCQTGSENNVDKDDMKHETTMDIEGKPANARTESENIKLQTDDESVKRDSGKVVQGEKSYAAVNCMEAIGCKGCDLHNKTELVIEVIEDCCTKCSEETDGSSSVEHSQDKVSVTINEPYAQRTHGDTDICHPELFLGDMRHSEMSPSDCDMLSTEKRDICHPVVSPGDSKQELHNDTYRDDNNATVNRNSSHEDNRCVDGTELCRPGVLREGGGNTLLQTEDKRVSDGDTVTQSDVESPSHVPSDRPTCDLVNLDLYVQAESDVMLLLLMEDGVTSHEETVTDVVCLYSSSDSLNLLKHTMQAYPWVLQ